MCILHSHALSVPVLYVCAHYSHLVSSSHTGMTDAERDAIDNEAQQYMKVCTDAIRQLKVDGLYLVYDGIGG